MKTVLVDALWVIAAVYIVVWVLAVVRRKHWTRLPGPLDAGIGLITNFLDTLGVGSFATTSSLFKLCGLVRDEQIPGTLNVGHTLPTITEALIYLAVVEVDVTTLVSMIAASAVGAWLGAGVVSHWHRRRIQIGMGSVLIAAAIIMALRQLHWIPGGGNSLGVSGTKLVVAVLCNAILGALMTLGIGLYAPCMMLVAALGMNVRAAYPIMMGSCAFLMPVGSTRFIRANSYNLKSALGLAIGGIPGVLLAAYLVKELPLAAVTWLVVGVLIYTSAMMLRSAHLERGTQLAEAPAEVSAD
ncbi:MAG TPA: sulfite exporter TauE/SafE family protein [Bryobacteraceae bacterium]|nr:sulfite exporter TauE/SafE family protein [Bryobacteraceae bacterium]